MFLYRVLSVLALMAYSPVALLRSVTGRRRMGSVRGKLGLLPFPNLSGGIWIHAVSVGEVGVARNLIRALRGRVPDVPLGLSVTTAAGLATARSMAREGVQVFSFPLDLAGPVEKALHALRPGLILLTETELWPLLISRAHQEGVPVALVNGRISERSFRRYRLVRRWFAGILEKVSAFAMQSEEDAERIRRLDAPSERVLVTGNIKFDAAPAPPFSDAERLSEAAAGGPVLVVGSTGQGEEEIVLEAWKGLDPRPLLAMAPRRPERFDEVARLIESKGFAVIRRSRPGIGNRESGIEGSGAIRNPQSEIRNPPVYLLDTVGELASLYGQADMAFLGGSLVPTGGHNPIEAWAQGVAVLVGPHTGNFRETTESGERLGFLERVADGDGLARALRAAFGDPAAAHARGEAARAFVAGSRGAAEATAEAVLPLLSRESRARAAAP
jgi:3-deoxy-D-manno-octulosonic-acid transferase